MNIRLCNPIAMLLLGACCSVTMLSCTKAYDYLKDHSPASCCHIDSVAMTFPGPTPGVQRFHFLYNSSGQPVKIAAQVPSVYNYQDYIFRYDSRGRLKDYLFTDGGGGTYVYLWDRYTYPAPHTVVDTTYTYQGHTSDPNPIYPNSFTSVRTITQDGQGRTSRIINWASYGSDTVYTHYDAQGDVILPGVAYDDKVNWYQLSPTWQLVFNDYSTHNQFIPATVVFPPSITSYDMYGLPTSFQQRTETARLMVFTYFSLQVYYSCDKPTDTSYLRYN